MSRERERELERALSEMPMADEAGAEERAWEVVSAAYAERTPVRPTYRARRLALALAGGVAALAIGLSPAGAKVGDLVEDVIGVGEEDAKPALRSLPAAGELLVESEQGVWIVREDGSKRLLGDYREATWSPRGLFVAAASGRQLVAVDPLGEVRWTITAPGPVSDPRWSPSGFRIAYRSGDDLRAVAGDGTANRLIARDVAPVAPAWRPIGDAKLAPDGAGSHVVTYVKRDQDVRTVDVDSGNEVGTTQRDLDLLSTPPTGGTATGRATSPAGNQLATIRRVGRRDELVLQRDRAGRARVLFSARANLTGPAWSPDGRWLLVGWREANQWLFIRTDRRGRIVAFDRITEQFDPGGTGTAGFPRVAGWVLPQR
jgi:WD40-like Beta Propeller Repeat